MAGDYTLAPALVASALVHAAILYLPMNPAGFAPRSESRVIQARLVSGGLDSLVAQMPESTSGNDGSRLQSPEDRQTEITSSAPRSAANVMPTADFRGTDAVALLSNPLPPPVTYHRVSEVTHRAVLQRPALQEQFGRDYPPSDTTLIVRINELGTVDKVIVLRATEQQIADEAQTAFLAATYFPARIGHRPVKAELVVQVISGPEGISFIFPVLE